MTPRSARDRAGAAPLSASAASRGPRRLSWDHDDGFMKAPSREDAIFMNVVSLTRRDGPDAVRNSSRPRLMETIHEDGVRFNEDAASRTLLGELLRREVRVVAPVQQQFNFPPVLVPVIVRVF